MSNLTDILTDNYTKFRIFSEDFSPKFEDFSRSDLQKRYKLRLRRLNIAYFDNLRSVYYNDIFVGFINYCNLDLEYQFISTEDFDQSIPLYDQEYTRSDYSDTIRDLVKNLCLKIEFNKAGLNIDYSDQAGSDQDQNQDPAKSYNKYCYATKSNYQAGSGSDQDQDQDQDLIIYDNFDNCDNKTVLEINDHLLKIADLMNLYTADINLIDQLQICRDTAGFITDQLNKVTLK